MIFLAILFFLLLIISLIVNFLDQTVIEEKQTLIEAQRRLIETQRGLIEVHCEELDWLLKNGK